MNARFIRIVGMLFVFSVTLCAQEPLARLMQEAEKNNPQILAAGHAWRAATQIPSQASTLPDPQVTVQHLAVGSPRPFAGFSNSDFAYIGVGVSQDLPYPGKLRLKGEMAQRDAAAASERFESMRRSVMEQLKAIYFQLAYVQESLAIIERNGKLLDNVERATEARYRAGQGNQQDVLKAQLQQTRLLRETEMRRQEQERLQAQFKQILNRPADAPSITTEKLTETPLNYSLEELLSRVRTQNPQVREGEEKVRRQSLQVELAHKDFYPDFNVQYMWQRTAEQFRDYHVLTFGVRIPVHQSRKQRPELAQAAEELQQSRREYEARVQQSYFDIRDQYLAADTSRRVLKLYREGLIPQATGTFRAGMAAYESNRQDFETLLSSFLDVLTLDGEYWHTLADHETAIARLEQITGINLSALEGR
jgi:cobalt-zinc-cadmium efflux system outer membrane protein